MIIRPYRKSDLECVAALFTESVHGLASGLYDSHQLEAWAPFKPDLQAWTERLNGLSTLVADEGGDLVGFISYDESGHMAFLYVVPRYAKQGVGTALFRQAESAVFSAGCRDLVTEASLVARPFFEKLDFKVLGEQRVVRNGTILKRFFMRKEPE
jgi:putative acetyltransferase